MRREQIVFVGTSDLSGHFRGKSFPAVDLPARSIDQLDRDVLEPHFLSFLPGVQLKRDDP